MSKASTLIVIPARIASTRFPRKVLQRLGEHSIVEWCRRAAVRARCGEVLVATDHADVLKEVESHGGAAVMTPAACRSGTDRVHRALRVYEKKTGRRFKTILNMQGDEPFIRPATIRKVADLARRSEMSTAVVSMRRTTAASDPNRVKAAVASDGRCLYFSRSPIPYNRAGKKAPLLQHIGIYGFSRSALEKFVRLRPSPLEKMESLEQLRALEAGMTIRSAYVREETLAIDTPADLARAKRYLSRNRKRVSSRSD